jgi:hypothetical protein
MDEEAIKGIILGTGYGKPPQQSQFKKGQSGNPKGRPKKAASDLPLTDQPTLSAVLLVANKAVPVRDGGEMTAMSMLEAVVAATAACAVKGNARSQATFIGLAQKAYDADARERHRSTEFWTDYKRVKSAQLAVAAKRGEPTPSVLPHPDDIIIDHAKGPRFVGPFDEEEEARLNETIRLRDTLIMQDEWDHRSTVRLSGGPLTEPRSAGLMSILLDRGVPPRLQLSETQRILKMMTYQSMPQRELLKLLFGAWRRLGSPRPRGYVSPNLTYTEKYMRLLFGLVSSVREGAIDPLSMPQEELADIIYERAKLHGIAV